MIFSAIKIFGWTVPLLEFSVGPAVGVRLWWSNWFLVGVQPKNIYCVSILVFKIDLVSSNVHSKPKVGDITTFVGKNLYNHKKVGSLTTKNGPHTHKSS
jgi:hypothetical protein